MLASHGRFSRADLGAVRTCFCVTVFEGAITLRKEVTAFQMNVIVITLIVKYELLMAARRTIERQRLVGAVRRDV